MDRNKVTSFFDNWQSDDAFIALPESEKALIVATAAHQGQKDKAGVDYIEHPKFIANNPAFDDETKAVGLLHDVPEDNTDFTLDDLSSVFSERVVAGVAAMKHEDGIPYFDYVEAGANNEDFRLIKAADNNHNMDRSRFPKGKIPSEGLLRKWILSIHCATHI